MYKKKVYFKSYETFILNTINQWKSINDDYYSFITSQI